MQARWDQDKPTLLVSSHPTCLPHPAPLLYRPLSCCSLQLTSDVATLYRSGMGPEARQREREVQRELQDRETELRGVLAEVRSI